MGSALAGVREFGSIAPALRPSANLPSPRGFPALPQSWPISYLRNAEAQSPRGISPEAAATLCAPVHLLRTLQPSHLALARPFPCHEYHLHLRNSALPAADSAAAIRRNKGSMQFAKGTSRTCRSAGNLCVFRTTA